MRGGTDDEAHGATGPILLGRWGRGDEEGVGVVLGVRGSGVPLP